MKSSFPPSGPEGLFGHSRNLAAELLARAGGGGDEQPHRSDPERSVSLLVAALEATADGILVVDNRGRIVTCNRKFIEMWRLPEEVIASGDQQLAIAHVLEHLRDPEGFVARVSELR